MLGVPAAFPEQTAAMRFEVRTNLRSFTRPPEIFFFQQEFFGYRGAGKQGLRQRVQADLRALSRRERALKSNVCWAARKLALLRRQPYKVR